MSVTQAVSSDVQTEIISLNAGWYNYLVGAMGLDPTTFMLAQGTLGLQTADSRGLFEMADSVPPSASVYYDAGGVQKLSAGAQMLLVGLLPESDPDALQNALGDNYESWVVYKSAYYADSANKPFMKQYPLFQQWADETLDPGEEGDALAAFNLAAHTPLTVAGDNLNDPNAQEAFNVPGSSNPLELYKYTSTIDAANRAINSGQSLPNIAFDSNSMETTLSHDTVQGAASGFYDFFSGGGSASFETLNTTAAGSRLTITGEINKFATLVAEPDGQWYPSSEVTRAFNAKDDNTVWDPNAKAGNWDSFFGPTGQLARRVSQMLLISGMDITVTSEASYSEDDVQQINTHAEFGIWPFFSGSEDSSSTREATLNDQGQLVVEHKQNPGLIQIWGVTVEPAPS